MLPDPAQRLDICHSVYECVMPAGVSAFQSTVPQHDQHQFTSS